jgi:hypothetical protein
MVAPGWSSGDPSDAVVISLLTCGGDEEMAQLCSRDRALLAYVSQRPNSSTCDAD